MIVRPVGGPAAWRGDEIAADPTWVLAPGPEVLDRLVARAVELAARVRSGEIGLADIGASDAEIADLVDLGADLRRRLFDGPGFALLRGLPVDDLDDVENQVVHWLLGVHVGVPLRQNPAGDVMIRVRDEGKDFDEAGVRAYETTAALDYHTDSSDVVTLYCVRPALEGGVSTIVSSVAIHDEMARTRPDLAALLHEPWPELNPIDGSVTRVPICALDPAGRLFTRYGRKYTELAAQASDGVALTPAQVDALDLVDEISRRPGFALDMSFRPGDVQFLANHVVMHARTSYVDAPDEQRRRELLRMWLVIPTGFDPPEVFREAGFVSRTVAVEAIRGGG